MFRLVIRFLPILIPIAMKFVSDRRSGGNGSSDGSPGKRPTERS